METKINKPNTFLWKLYFVTCGILSLICWNSVLNLGDYINEKFSATFFVYMTFSFSLGSLLSFVISPVILGKLKHRPAVLLALVLTFVTFFLTFFFMNVIENQEIAQFLSAMMIFLCGFFGSFFQSKSAGLAASASNTEIILFNFGTGIAGFSSNIFYFIIEKIFPKYAEATDKFDQLQKQLYAYFVIVTIFGVLFFIIEDLYERNHSEYFDTKSEQEIEAPFESEVAENDKNVAMNSIKIIRRCLDMLVGLLFQYVIVLVIISYFLIKTSIKFEDSNNTLLNIPFYFFCFNLCDSLGKFIDSSKLIYSPNKLHITNFLKLLFVAYFVYLVYFDVPAAFLSSSVFRCIVFIILGLINGYFTNCFFGISANRLEKPLEKGKAAYFSVFFMLLGITIGNLLGILYDPGN